MANMKNVSYAFLEIDNPPCGYCFKSFSLCILVQLFRTTWRMVELTAVQGQGDTSPQGLG